VFSMSGRYHYKDPDSGIECDTEPPAPEESAYRRISWQARADVEAIELDYIIKAYMRATVENRVRMMAAVRGIDTLP
jgi:hypothetical protein